MAISVRALQADDKPEWLGLWRGYVEFYECDVSDAVTETTFARLLDDAEPMTALVALDDDGRIQGLAHCVFHRNTWTDRDVCYLEDLFVCPTARHEGVGKALIEAVRDHATDLGCFRVYWMTRENNNEARALYDSITPVTSWVRYDLPL